MEIFKKNNNAPHCEINLESGVTVICGSLFTGTLRGSIHAILYYNEFYPCTGLRGYVEAISYIKRSKVNLKSPSLNILMKLCLQN